MRVLRESLTPSLLWIVCALALFPSRASAQVALINGGSQTAAISAPGETDSYTFTAALGDYISVSIGEKLPAGPDPLFTPWIRLYRPDGALIGNAANAVATQIAVTAPLTGTYTVIAADYNSNRTGTYVLHLIKAPGTFAIPSGDEGGPMTNGANHQGRIGAPAGQPIVDDPGDIDPWTFTADKNDYLVISVGEVPPGEVDPGFTPYIRLIGPTGAVVGYAANAVATQIAVAAPLTGTYTVIVSDYNDNRTGNYIVHLVKSPGTLTVPTGDEGGPMTNGANHKGRIGGLAGLPITNDPGDLDAWTFTADKGDYLVVAVGEVPAGEIDPGFTPYIRLIGPTGAVVGYSANAVATEVAVPAPLTGSYTVIVSDYNENRTGDYILHLVKAPGTLTVPTGDEGGPMTNGANHRARIGGVAGQPITGDPGDLDAWTFTADKGDYLAIAVGEVPPGEIDPGFTPYIRLIGPTGVVVGYSANAVGTQVAVTAPLTGTYTVIVSDYNENRTGDYILHLVKAPGTFIVPPGDEGGAMVNHATHSGRIGATADPLAGDPGDLDPWTFRANQGNALVIAIGEVEIPEIDPGFTPYIRLIGPTGVVVGYSANALATQIAVTTPLTGRYTVIVSDYNENRTGKYQIKLDCTGCPVDPVDVTVTPSAGPHGSISPNTPQVIASGATTGFTVTPDAGYAISSVTGCGGTLVGNIFTTGPVTASCSVVATFGVPLPTMSLDKTALTFGAVTTGAAFTFTTPPQIVRLIQNGAGTVAWTATPNQPWLHVSPTSGTGPADLSISVGFAPGLNSNATWPGSVALTFVGAGNSPGPIATTLNVTTNPANPLGTIDTPVDGRTGVTGAVPFTGWAVDDVGVSKVTVCRAAFGAEVAPVDGNCGGAAQIFVGTAVSIDGARPDVAAAFPTYPANTIAGWGFMVLTNMLPNQGNGTYVFYAYAQDREGHTTLLGTRTMTCANALATLPFGAIDTPAQGGTASGTAYVNFGWALTPQPKTIPVSGSTITVLVDGLSQGSVDYDHFRSDIATLFPGLNNTNGAVGFKVLDTTTLGNGIHTIVWVVTDNQGATEGIGSRYFTILNGAAAASRTAVTEAATRAAATLSAADVAMLPRADSPVRGRRGWDLGAPYESYPATGRDRIVVRGEEVDRFELALGGQPGGRYTGYLRTGDELAALPIGSTLDPATGVFTWAPGVGFVGAYDFVFVRSDAGAPTGRQEVRIVLQPKGRAATGPHVVIDTPTRQQDVGQPFMLAGWAADLGAAAGTGIATLHVWAYPLAGGPPVFLGVADRGGRRPDVAAAYGEQFQDAGYGLVVHGLTPGNYDLAVFGYSTVTGGFVPASVVRVTVR